MKKGFTLVELLAVIAILAILAIISLPNIMDMFNTAKANSFTTELKTIHKVAQQKWISDSLFDTGEKIYARCKTGNCPDHLDLSGRTQLEYYIKVNKAGNITEYLATDGTFQYSYVGENFSPLDITVERIADIDPANVIVISCPGSAGGSGTTTEDPTPYVEGHNYFIVETNEYYESLASAINAVNSNQTIKVMADMTEASNPIIVSSKAGIKLDLNGKTLNMQGYNIVNMGSLDIYNSSSTPATIAGSGDQTIKNSQSSYGSLTINGTMSNNKVIIKNTSNFTNATAISEGSSLVVNNNTEIVANKTAIFASRNTTINGGTITGGYRGIVTPMSGTTILTINGGTINATEEGIFAQRTTTINIHGGAITGADGVFGSHEINMTNGTITGTGENRSGINFVGTLNMTGGTVTGYYGVELGNGTNSGQATITGGSITGSFYGIFIRRYCTLTLGVDDGSVSATSPLIQMNNSSGSYGIYNQKINSNSGTFNYYDGVIKSSAGDSTAINGVVTSTPNRYIAVNSVDDGIETVKLMTK